MTDKYSLKDKTICVVDFGNQIQIAQRLARDYGKVILCIPSVLNGYKGHKALDIGRNVENIIRVEEYERYKSEIDIFCFTDIHLSGTQEQLRSEGFPVFGSGTFGQLESNRLGFKKLLESLELPVNEYEIAEGINELEEKLKVLDDRYIKSSLRLDMETWHHQNYILSKMELKEMENDMGIYENQETYIIDSPIKAVGEVGYDGFCINGTYPIETLCGIEIKDAGYVGRIIRYKDLPKQITESLDKLAPIFQNGNYMGAISTEVRVDKNKVGYFTDLTARFPEPPTSLMLELYTNFSEIIWDVANGIVPKIEYKYNWGVELILKSESAKTKPVAIQFPDEYKNFIKLKNLVIDDDGTYFYSDNGVPMQEIGACIGLGRTLDEAIKMAKEVAQSIKGFDVKINIDSIEDAQDEIQELRKNGIRFL